jgi:hypothetical protein
LLGSEAGCSSPVANQGFSQFLRINLYKTCALGSSGNANDHGGGDDPRGEMRQAVERFKFRLDRVAAGRPGFVDAFEPERIQELDLRL